MNYISDTFGLCNTILDGFWLAFWNVGDISTADWIIRHVDEDDGVGGDNNNMNQFHIEKYLATPVGIGSSKDC